MQTLLAYYKRYTKKDGNGKIITFGATASIGNGQIMTYTKSVQQVALFSSRGPNVKDFNFDEADILKPNVMAPGYLIWGAWSPIGTDNPAFTGTHRLHSKSLTRRIKPCGIECMRIVLMTQLLALQGNDLP